MKNIEIENLNNLIEKLQDDKVKLSKRVSKLLDNGNCETKIVQKICI